MNGGNVLAVAAVAETETAQSQQQQQRWQWQEGSKTWVDYPDSINDILNKGLADGLEQVSFSVDAAGNRFCSNENQPDLHSALYTVNFRTLRQTSMQTHFQRNVRRKPDSHDNVLPYYPFPDQVTCIIVSYLPFDSAYLLAEAADLEALNLWRTLFVRDYGNVENSIRRGKGYQARLRKFKKCIDNPEYWENRYMERLRQGVPLCWATPSSSAAGAVGVNSNSNPNSHTAVDVYKNRSCDAVPAGVRAGRAAWMREPILTRDLTVGDWIVRDGDAVEVVALVGIAKSGKHGYGRVFFKERNPFTERTVLQCSSLACVVPSVRVRRIRIALFGADLTTHGLVLHTEHGELVVSRGTQAFLRIEAVVASSSASLAHAQSWPLEGEVQILELPTELKGDSPDHAQLCWLAVDVHLNRTAPQQAQQ